MSYKNFIILCISFLQCSSTCPLPVLVSSSCSTDETIVADSEAEVETATSIHATTNISSEETPKNVNNPEISMVNPPTRSGHSHVVNFTDNNGGMTARREKVDEPESGNPDIIYSQDLIIRELNLPATISSTANDGVLNFKLFKKVMTFFVCQ